ncbi:serine/threonine-protein kinase [Nonomuraea sp. B12E4]|uniref:serine/threonine-protein kinase n=1 Tax=Nonomuraea sp. B12E4 TaxID=3153564 RepID=UPI00325CE693
MVKGVAVRPGTTIDRRYRLTRRLARGQTGEVWLARDRELGRDVVLKRLADGDGGTFDRLWAEARALARFSHAHVVTLYHAVRVGRGRRATSWLVMEYVPGGSLEGRPPMSPGLAARIGAQIAGAVAALHAEGIVHCDIKPGNVVVTADGTAKLADFGAAYRVGGVATITPNSAIGYTPDYAAPEVVRGQPEKRSDVFSLAAMVYTLVAGRPPRRGTSGADSYNVRWEAARAEIVLEAELGPLADVLRPMLSRDPDERPGAAEARLRLEAVAGAPEPIPEPDPAGDGRDEHGPGWRFVRRPVLGSLPGPFLGPVPVVGLVALAAALALALAVPSVMSGWDGPTPTVAVERPTPTPGGGRPAPPPSLLGDPRTADPCALLEPASLGRFGRTELDVDYGNFDRCDVLVHPENDSVVDVRVDFNHDQPPEQVDPAHTTGRVSVLEDPAESDECMRTLVLSGVHDSVVTVTAKRDERGKAPLCEIADLATSRAVEVLNQGPVKRRSPGLPAGSLAHQDACTLLNASALEIIPGVDAADPDPGFGRWDCEWDSTTSDTWLTLRFDRGQPPDASDGTATRLNGFRAVIEPAGEGDDTCLVQVVYRSYSDQHGETAVETVRLLVGGSRPMDRLCRMATELAGSATAGLARGRVPDPTGQAGAEQEGGER